mgnify:CR=1 FL=1
MRTLFLWVALLATPAVVSTAQAETPKIHKTGIPDQDRVFGEVANINNPRDAKHYGIETIYQQLAVADNVDAAANLFLWREMITSMGTLDDAAMESKAREVMGRLNPNFRRFCYW